MAPIFKDSLNWKDPKVTLKLIAMVLLFGVIVFSILRDRFVYVNNWQISAVGQGKVSYQPDVATVTIGVQVDKATTAQSALNELNGTMKKTVEAIKKAGISDADIQTQAYSLFPAYDYIDGVSKVGGYNASQQLMVKVRDIDKESDAVSNVIAAASKAGINQIQNIAFEPSNLKELKEQARLLAIEDAQKNAEAIASSLGVKLKKVVGWWENIPYNPTPYYGYAAEGKGGGAGAGVSNAITPTGTSEIMIEANVSYLIK